MIYRYLKKYFNELTQARVGRKVCLQAFAQIPQPVIFIKKEKNSIRSIKPKDNK